jgi:NADPH:quinone reductase-like Zn-dependent oxidoreductase
LHDLYRLQVTEELCPLVVEPLSHLPVPDGIVIEFFVASHNPSILRSLGQRFKRHQSSVVLRRVLLKSDKSPGVSLYDVTFHALIVDDWPRTGATGLPMPQPAEHQVFQPQEAPSRARVLLDKLHPFLVPGAQIMVRGFTPIPQWARLLSKASPQPLPDNPEDERMAMDGARQDWLSTLQALRGGEVEEVGVIETSGLSMLLSRLPSVLPQRSGRYLMAVASAAQAQEMTLALQAAARGGVSPVAVPLVVDDVTSAEDLAQQLEGALSEPLEALIFVAGLDDTSTIGEDAHSRLLRFLQAVILNEDLMTTQINELQQQSGQALRERPHLYILSEGVFAGDIRPNQAVHYGLLGVCFNELRPVTAKLVDLCSTQHVSRQQLLPTAMAMVLGSHREQTTCVRGVGDVVVQRSHAIDHKKARSLQLLPSDDRCYFAAVSARAADALGQAQILTPGVVHAAFQLTSLPPLADDDVVVEIEAAGLNFRDVMISLSLLPEQSYERSYFGKNFGMEAAGVVSSVGSVVTNVKVGDRVSIAEPRTFANRLVTKAERVVRMPDDMPFVAAASMQSVYNTCQYALVNLARVRKGQRVLIHSAAGGIGHAAISICRYLGAEILATAGSEEKRQIVRDLGVQHVFDSHSTSWYEDVMKATQGEGVDVVLNSLAGLHQRLGLQALRSSGRFCEIGKASGRSGSDISPLLYAP